jgi:hypothetical protein
MPAPTVSASATPDAARLFGLPAQNLVLSDIQQTHPYSCSVKAQQIALEALGIHRTEDELLATARERNWYGDPIPDNGWRGYDIPGGTNPQDVGKLIEMEGIATKHYKDATWDDLRNELAQGHQVIVNVDTGELRKDGFFGRLGEHLEDILFPNADHTIIVDGMIETSNSRTLILTDSGNGQYRMAYPDADRFRDAWADDKYRMIAICSPTEDYLSMSASEAPAVSFGAATSVFDRDCHTPFGFNTPRHDALDFPAFAKANAAPLDALFAAPPVCLSSSGLDHYSNSPAWKSSVLGDLSSLHSSSVKSEFSSPPDSYSDAANAFAATPQWKSSAFFDETSATSSFFADPHTSLVGNTGDAFAPLLSQNFDNLPSPASDSIGTTSNDDFFSDILTLT